MIKPTMIPYGESLPVQGQASPGITGQKWNIAGSYCPIIRKIRLLTGY